MYHEALEYEKLKEILKRYTLSSLGNRRVDQLQPSCDFDAVQYQQRLCSEITTYQESVGDFSLRGIRDISTILDSVSRRGSVLHIEQLLSVSDFLSVAKRVRAETKKLEIEDYPILVQLTEEFPVFPELSRRINRCLTPEGKILDSASQELRSIRRKQMGLHENIHNQLGSILRSSSYQKSIQENIITSRNHRFVIPVKHDHKSSLSGIVQGQSASGATVFFEPIEIVEKNNQLLQLSDAEQEEIRRIFRDLSASVYEKVFELRLAQEILGELEFQSAKAKLSRRLNCVEPIINTSGYLELTAARHPLLEINLHENSSERSPHEIVPTSVHLGGQFNTILITGPNTGGKTVVLKTVGLLSLMAQSGLHIPAEKGSELPIFEHVFADIGDEQSIDQNLSTFSSHMTKIIAMQEKANQNTLVLLDEIGAGTDPTEGTALGIAIIDHFSKIGSKTILTTHYNALKAFAHDHPDMANASMEFDLQTLNPTYRLQMGVPGSSNAIKIAERLGMKVEILSVAKNQIGSQPIAVEELLTSIQQSQHRLDQQLNLVDQELIKASANKEKYQRKLDDFEADCDLLKRRVERESAEILKQSRKLVEETIAQIRQKDASRESVRSALDSIEREQELLKQKEVCRIEKKNQLPPDFSVSVGDKVLIKDLNQFGEVISISKKSRKPLCIQVGSVKMTLSYPEVSLPLEETKNRELSSSILTIQHRKSSSVESELNLIGQKVAPALNVLDKYLDDAYLAGLLEVRLIHGKGTGSLGTAVHEYLRDHWLVTNFAFAEVSLGGTGATVVSIKGT